MGVVWVPLCVCASVCAVFRDKILHFKKTLIIINYNATLPNGKQPVPSEISLTLRV